jgi:hypothetical protein
MANRTFSKEFLEAVIGCEEDEAVVLEEIEGESGRWTQQMKTVFSFEGKNYSVSWERGLTEYQHQPPLEGEPDNIDVPEVEQVEVVVKKWRKCKP